MSDIVRVIIDTKKLDDFAKKINGTTSDALKSVALQTEGLAKTYAPVDTGALKNSLHTEKKAELSYIVGDGVEYGIYQELGTYKMAAHPFLVPALKRAVKDLYKSLKEGYEKAMR
jgi:HK97 gp10 family phage protein